MLGVTFQSTSIQPRGGGGELNSNFPLASCYRNGDELQSDGPLMTSMKSFFGVCFLKMRGKAGKQNHEWWWVWVKATGGAERNNG